MRQTSGGSGTGSEVSDVAFTSFAYHQSRNWRKNTPTDTLVDTVTAAILKDFLMATASFC